MTSGNTPEHLPHDPTVSYRPDELKSLLGETIETERRSSSSTFDAVEIPTLQAVLPPRERGYHLQRVVGEGGSGVVWKALQLSLSRDVAVKTIRNDRIEKVRSNPKALRFILQQFEQEALTTAHLEHPNIVPVYDLSTDPEGRPLLTMKRVRGTPWSVLLEEDYRRLSFEDYLMRHVPILLDAAQAVAYAHSRGIVHRDLKPSQVMVGDYGEVLLMDWGLAVAYGQEDDEAKALLVKRTGTPPLQLASSPAGTPAYMAPEQTEQTALHVGPWTDVYLLGGTLFFVLTGRPPHPIGSAEEVFEMARQGIVSSPAEVAPGRPIPQDLLSLVAATLEPNRERRLQHASEFVARLQDYMSGTSKRRESVQITSDVAESMASKVTKYSDFGQLLARLTNADVLWPRNPDVPSLRQQVLVAYAHKAIENADLVMARSQAEQLPPGEERAKLIGIVEEAEDRVARRESQRRVARMVAAALIIVIVFVSIVALIQAGRANEARREAQAALEETQRQNEIAQEMTVRAAREQYFSAIGYANATLPLYNTKRIRSLLDSCARNLRGWEWEYLNHAITSESVRIDAPFQLLTVAVSHDGTLAAYGGESPVFDASPIGGGQARSFIGHQDKIYELDFSPDDKLIASASKDTTIRLWDVATGQTVKTLSGHKDFVRSVRFHPTRPELLSSSSDGTARIWNLETGDVKVLQVSNQIANSARYDAAGERIATVGREERVLIWDAQTGQRLHDFAVPLDYSPTCAEFSPDGRQLAVSDWGDQVITIDAETGQLLHRLDKMEDSVFRLVYRQGDGSLITPSFDHTVAVWDAQKGTLEYRLVGHEAGVWCARILPGDDRLATASYDRTVRVWDLTELDPRAHRVADPAVIPPGAPIEWVRLLRSDDSSLASTDDGWVSSEGRTLVRVGNDHYNVVEPRYVFAADGSWRIDLNDGGRIYDQASGRLVKKLGEGRFHNADASPDGRLLAVSQQELRVYSTDTWEVALEIPALPPVKYLTFDASSRLLGLNTENSVTQVWDVIAKRQVSIADEGQPMGTYSMAFSPDSKELACGLSPSYNIAVYDVQTGQHLYDLVGHTYRVFDIDYSPDGSRIASTAWDNSVRIWERGTGREVLVFDRHFSELVSAVQFSKDGKRLIAPTAAGQIEVWRTD